MRQCGELLFLGLRLPGGAAFNLSLALQLSGLVLVFLLGLLLARRRSAFRTGLEVTSHLGLVRRSLLGFVLLELVCALLGRRLRDEATQDERESNPDGSVHEGVPWLVGGSPLQNASRRGMDGTRQAPQSSARRGLPCRAHIQELRNRRQ